MKRKLRSRRGFTLAETMIVIVILSLMTAAGIAGISNVMASRVTMVRAADADILGSTAFQAIADELRFGQDIKIAADGKSVELDSVTYGTGATLTLDSDGKLIFDSDGSQILGAKAYSSGLKLQNLTFTAGSGVITVRFEVTANGGALATVESTVTPLNAIA